MSSTQKTVAKKCQKRELPSLTQELVGMIYALHIKDNLQHEGLYVQLIESIIELIRQYVWATGLEEDILASDTFNNGLIGFSQSLFDTSSSETEDDDPFKKPLRRMASSVSTYDKLGKIVRPNRYKSYPIQAKTTAIDLTTGDPETPVPASKKRKRAPSKAPKPKQQ